jgi:hypothetical protein
MVIHRRLNGKEITLQLADHFGIAASPQINNNGIRVPKKVKAASSRFNSFDKKVEGGSRYFR